MFYDEKIMKESASIYRKAHILFMGLSLAILVMKLFLQYVILYWFHGITMRYSYWVEGCLFLESLVALFIGEVVYQGEGEMEYESRAKFYQGFRKAALFALILGQSLELAWKLFSEVYFHTFDVTSIYIIFILFIFFHFKKNSISMNYDIMEENTKEYYLHIVKRILLMVLAIILVYCIPLSVALYKGVPVNESITSCAYCLSICPSVYFLLSLIERLDHQDESDGIKKSALPLGIVVLTLTGQLGILGCINIFFTRIELNQRVISYTNTYSNALAPVSSLFLLVSVCYLFDHLKKNKVLNHSLTKLFYVMFYMAIASFFLTFIRVVVFYALSFYGNAVVSSKSLEILSYVSFLMNQIIIGFIIYNLIQFLIQGYNKILILSIVCYGLQSLSLYLSFGCRLVTNVSLFVGQLVIFLVLWKSRKTMENTDLENTESIITE